MGRQKLTGLQFRAGAWYIDKRVKGYGRLCESTGCSNKAEAEAVLISRLSEISDAIKHGVNQSVPFRDCMTMYLKEYAHLPSIVDAAYHFKLMDKYIGDLPVDMVHNDTLKSFVTTRLKSCKHKTINLSLGYVRRVLNLAARKWRDEITGKPLIASAPMIQMLKLDDQRKPKPITWDQQRDLIPRLPDHLANMVLFDLNTGARDAVVCGLKWEWERKHESLPYSVFLVPQEEVKGRKSEKFLVLNKIAQSVVDAQRGKDKHYVFTYRKHPIETMNNTAWQNARKKCLDPYLHDLHVHDLRHTVGARLRAAGVSEEDRADILWHSSKSMTAHYSLASLANLMTALDGLKSDREMLVTSLRRVS